MSQTPIRSDRGIRAIFATAMDLEPERRSRFSRLLRTIDRRHLGHAVAGGTFGAGAAVIGFMLLALSLPKSVSADPMAADVKPGPAIAKADRLPLPGGKLASIATDVEMERQPSSGIIDTGLVSPSALAYAVDRPLGDAAAAIEDHIDRVGPRFASLGNPTLVMPGATAAAIDQQGTDDEDDDEGVVAIPRARPDHAQAAVEPTVLPRPRPAHFASLAPLPLSGETSMGNAETEAEAEEDAPAPLPPPGPHRGEPRAPSGLLGFFSSPTEPVKAPPKISVDTPFGIPYVLQTASVETACLKPELIDVLRKVEAHYRQKVIITSGYRSRGREGSLHRTCAAADIEIPGVTAAQLASFARTIPGIGGVGTYCHASMIHVDIGMPRDWKYGCGSFFAMRGAPGKWGKVPATLAAAQPGGEAKLDPRVFQE